MEGSSVRCHLVITRHFGTAENLEGIRNSDVWKGRSRIRGNPITLRSCVDGEQK